jgi:hypothetical protein
MKAKLLWFIVGGLTSIALLVGGFFALFSLDGGGKLPVHEQVLASGKTVKIIAFHLAWGVEHDERFADRDTLALEYISPLVLTNKGALDSEVTEVFELIRPVSEQWKFPHASISAFSSIERKGKYWIYTFNRGPTGAWNFESREQKVYANE